MFFFVMFLLLMCFGIILFLDSIYGINSLIFVMKFLFIFEVFNKKK